jgi:thioredoxin 1
MTQVSTVVSVTDATFAEEVLQSDLPVLVDFTADWCAPCRMISPILVELASEEAGRLKIVSVDVDMNPQTQSKYQVMSMPTLMVFQAGQPIKSLVGARPKKRLKEDLADVL